jgi:pimeloyl-ACP methyl ester carboxylesterase
MRVVRGAGHVPMLERPAEFADALAAVLPYG